MTDPTPLSPAAQAVLDAYGHYSESWCGTSCILDYELRGVAAALRAAADQVFPLERTPWGSTLIPVLTSQESRSRLLALATELEKGNEY